MTEKDIADAILQLTKNDWIALSFKKTPRDLQDLQELIEHSDYKIPQ
jgi:pyruvate kinase